MLNLKNITVVSINTRDPENSIKAIERSSKYINFGKHILISSEKIKHDYIETKIIEKISNLEEYSYFCVKQLNSFIDTDFCLLVQPDGFVTNPMMWIDKFLNFDYIGAPWDILLSRQALYNCGIHIHDLSKVPIIVGNGGFSLRSKKFLHECSLTDYNDPRIPEDNFVTISNREQFKNKGIKYADVSTAKRFSLECPIDLNEKNITLDAHFGFHGYHGYKKPLLDLLNNYDDDVDMLKTFRLTLNNH
jgi:hypothetical protein